MTFFCSLEIHFYPRGPRNHIARAALILSLVLENTYFVPRRAIHVHLVGLRDLLRLSGTPHETIKMIPKDPRSCAAHFYFDTVTHQYLSCPKCHCLYPYNPGNSPDNDLQPAISCCTYRKTPQSLQCNASLWQLKEIGRNGQKYEPCRKYLHQDLKF